MTDMQGPKATADPNSNPQTRDTDVAEPYQVRPIPFFDNMQLWPFIFGNDLGPAADDFFGQLNPKPAKPPTTPIRQYPLATPSRLMAVSSMQCQD